MVIIWLDDLLQEKISYTSCQVLRHKKGQEVCLEAATLERVCISSLRLYFLNSYCILHDYCSKMVSDIINILQKITDKETPTAKAS